LSIEVRANNELLCYCDAMPYNEQGLLAVGELTNCPPGTEAKFITKSRS